MTLYRRCARRALARAYLFAGVTLSLLCAPAHSATFYISSIDAANIYSFDSATISLTNNLQNATTVAPTTGATTYLDVSADGSRAVVIETTNSILHVIATASNTDHAIPLSPGGRAVVLSPDGKNAFVVFQPVGSAAHLSIINIDSATVTKDIALSAANTGLPALALTADGKRLFMTNSAASSVEVYDTASLASLASIAVDPGYSSIAVNPVNPRAYAVGGNGIFLAINTDNYAVVVTGPLGNPAQLVTVTPDGAHLFIVSAGSVVAFNWQVTDEVGVVPVPNGCSPRGLAFTPDSKTGYLACIGSNQVLTINTGVLQPYLTGNAPVNVPGPVFIATNRIYTPPPPPATTAFAKFTPELLVAPKLQAYSVAASFTIASGAPAVSPMTQELKLTVGTFTVTVPAGSIKKPSPKIDLYTYSGSINGANFGLIMTGKGTGPWGIVSVGSHAFGTLPSTTPVSITIGPSSGSVSVKPITASRVQSLN